MRIVSDGRAAPGRRGRPLGRVAAVVGAVVVVLAGGLVGCGSDGGADRARVDERLAVLERAAVSGVGFVAVSVGPVDVCGTSLISREACARPGAVAGSGVAVRHGHGCGLRADGVVACWGANHSGQSDAPVGEFVAVSAGAAHSCGLRVDGGVVCWGEHVSAAVDAPPGEFVALAAGGRGTCGLRAGGGAVCWGAHGGAAVGLLAEFPVGYGQWCSVTDRATVCPTAAGGDSAAPGAVVVSGRDVTCRLGAGGGLSCDVLRSGVLGALSGLSEGDRARLEADAEKLGIEFAGHPEQVTETRSGPFAAVAAGAAHWCALGVDGGVVCGGADAAGETDPPGGRFAGIGAGAAFSCGLRTSGFVACWGENTSGQAKAPGGRFGALAVGRAHACAIRDDGTVSCWGDGTPGQTAPPRGEFTTVAAGGSHTCALRAGAAAVCWGDGNRPSPNRVRWAPGVTRARTTGRDFGHFSVGGDRVGHLCAVRLDSEAHYNGPVSCWGSNSHGQTDAPEGRFSTLSAGGGHTCALRFDRTVACWGDNSHGQADAPEGRFGAVSAGAAHTCAQRLGGAVICWGANPAGEADAPAGPFEAIVAGSRRTCAHRADDTIECWGEDAGTAAELDAPAYHLTLGDAFACARRTDGTLACTGDIADPPGGKFAAVYAGDRHACALRADGTAACWGDNSQGHPTPPGGEFIYLSAGGDLTCGKRPDNTLECWGNLNAPENGIPWQ